MKLKHFDSPNSALAYLTSELLSTLRDDFEKMRGAELEHYADEERDEMENRIADLEAIAPLVRLETPDQTILIVGDIIGGVTMVGPFPDDDSATEYAQGYDSVGTPCWPAKLFPPEDL